MKRIFKHAICILILIHTSNIFAQDNKEKKVEVVIKDMIQKNNITGLQLAIVSNNKIVKTMNYGLSNIQDSVLVDSETVFSINSMTKSFTGVALMQLVENGKLNLDDPISKYLDDLPNNWQNITVKQLATHTSGIPGVWDSEENMLTKNNLICLTKIKKLPVVLNPGEQFNYNQTNYLLLIMIIEKISGKLFNNYLIENEFEKAGMKNAIKAGFADYYNVFKRAVKSSDRRFKNGDLIYRYEVIPENLRTSAGIYSTATEIANWLIALQNHHLIKDDKNLKILWTPTLFNNGKTKGMSNFLDGYAIGFYTSSRIKNPVIASLGGLMSGMYIYPKDNIAVIILTNSHGFHPEDYLEEIANLYIAENNEVK